MRNFKKIFALFHIFILLNFSLIVYSGSLLSLDTFFSKKHSVKDESSFLLFSDNLFCPSAQAESILLKFSELSITSPKNFLNSLIDRCRCIEQILLISFSKYVFYFINLIFWFQPTDIIFPFHYFW
jgi:hypothetical protein